MVKRTHLPFELGKYSSFIPLVALVLAQVSAHRVVLARSRSTRVARGAHSARRVLAASTSRRRGRQAALRALRAVLVCGVKIAVTSMRASVPNVLPGSLPQCAKACQPDSGRIE